MNQSAIQVIEALGGTAAVARIFEVKPPSVSDWKKHGIPVARVMFLKIAHRKALLGIDLAAATAMRRARVPDSSLAQPPSLTRELAHG